MSNQRIVQGTNLPSKADVTGQQVEILIQTIAALTPGLFAARFDEKLLDGEARIAVEVSIMKACSRLDEILGENDRWSLDQNRTMETVFLKLHEKHLEFVEAQLVSTRAIASPAYLYRPTLYPVDGVGWAAILGDPVNLRACVVGTGATPAEAYAAFDKAFSEKPSTPATQEVTVGAEPIPEPPIKKKTKRTKKI